MGRLTRAIHHYRAFMAHGRLTPRLSYAPPILRIEPTNHCNFKCTTCASHTGNAKVGRPKGYMDFGLYAELLRQAAQLGVKDVYLYYDGESLLHPRFVEMLRLAKERRFHLRLHTNAALLDEPTSREILAAGLDVLVFSLTGADKGSYEQVMIGGNFERTTNNIATFLRSRAERKLRRPYTQMQMIKLPGMPGDSGDYRQLAASLGGVDEVKFTEYMPLPGEGVSEEEKKRNRYFPCDQVWKQLTVYWDGKIAPCCEDYSGEYVLGDANNSALLDAWRSDKLSRLRDGLIAGRYREFSICRDCRQPWLLPPSRRGQRLNTGVKELLRHLAFKPRIDLE